MRKSLWCIVLLALTVLPNTGCYFMRGVGCTLGRWHDAVAARTYYDCECGKKYCCEWCSDPPACCEPCDNCGNYVGCRKNRYAGPKRGCPNCNQGCGCGE